MNFGVGARIDQQLADPMSISRSRKHERRVAISVSRIEIITSRYMDSDRALDARHCCHFEKLAKRSWICARSATHDCDAFA
jgi:hypothetical protein